LQFGLVRESLRERRIWETIGPHMVTPLAFIVPSRNWRAQMTLRAGLTLYDALSFDRNRLTDPDKMLPGHAALSATEAVAREPLLNGAAAAGALVYYDCQMHAPERLALEFILGAAANGARLANYAQVLRLNGADNLVWGARVRDQFTGAEYDIAAKLVINASGPWADTLAAKPGAYGPVKLRRSKGIHLVTRSLSRSAIAVLGVSEHFFVLPWRGHSLLATTDTPYLGDPDAVRVNEADIAALLEKVNRGLPAAKLTRADVLYCYAGLRPLVADPAAAGPGARNDTYGVSRGSEIFDHAQAEGRHGLISAIGGKWTTSRHLAEQVVDLALRKLGRPPQPCCTATTALPGGAMTRFNRFVEEATARHPHLPRPGVEHLARSYGTRIDALAALITQDPAMGARLAPHLPELGAQIRYAARGEMALTLEDAVFRRTGLCTLGHPGATALQSAAAIMAQELGWDGAEFNRQITVVEQRLVMP